MSYVLVSVGKYTQGTANKNNDMPLWLTPISGKLERLAVVLDGTVARNMSVECGKTYLMDIELVTVEGSEYPKRNYVVLGQPTMIEVLTLAKELGKGQVIDSFSSDEQSDAGVTKLAINTTEAEPA